jgi:hypothetical protein
VGISARHCRHLFHLVAAKRLLRYLQGTANYEILFPRQGTKEQGKMLTIGYSDADCCGHKLDRRNTSGYAFQFLQARTSRSSKKQ